MSCSLIVKWPDSIYGLNPREVVAILVKDELEPRCFSAKLPHIPAYIIQAVTTDP